jgi:hypothetical protein
MDRLVELPFERRHVTVRGPQLELGIAPRPEPRKVILAAREEIDAGQRLCVAAVEPLGEPDDRGEHTDGGAELSPKLAESLV